MAPAGRRLSSSGQLGVDIAWWRAMLGVEVSPCASL
jgi:hypothetical protein